MSLFPAYAQQAELNETTTETEKQWLENSSFQVDISILNKSPQNDNFINSTVLVDPEVKDNSESFKSSRKGKKKSKKKGHKKIETEEIPAVDQNENFVIDITGHRELLTVKTISRPSAPLYHIKYWVTSSKSKYKKKFKRYYQVISDKYINKSESEDDMIITKKNMNEAGFNAKDEHFTGFKQEEELSKKTAYFNSHLSDHPNDVKMWLDYIQFQDTIYTFEKSYRKGSIAKGQRLLAERKLCILDKALSKNPECELLHRERLKIAVGAFPSDELQTQLKELVDKEKGNIILWQGYIEATQCSMSHCNTPAVINLYTKCLSTLHQLRRAAALEKHLLEECILRMLYQCGLFLKQAGLFEQLWTLLQMYLETNLSQNKSKFYIASSFNEKQLIELEEVVFTSQLPLHELWLRTEKLRESCHWLPYLENEEFEDPQRVVFPEDVAELIQPITMPNNIFKLTSTVFSLLKIPLLPCRHTTMQDLGLDYVPWSLDSIEPLLSVFLPLYPIDITNKNLINDCRLAVGPQYLKTMPGQEEYLEFILLVMQNCTECLSGDDKVAIMIWLFRFQRLLIVLDKLQRFKMADHFRKKIKTSSKQLLKHADNRQNELYYLEYALIEFELGNNDSCLKIINTALSFNENLEILTQNWDKSQATRCYLYRILVQITLSSKRNSEADSKALQLLCDLVLQTKERFITSDCIQEMESRFNSITAQLLQNDIIKLQPLHHFLPDFFTDWLICHGWFIYLNKGAAECCTFLKDIMQQLDDHNKDPLWQKEVLYEFYVAVLFNHCTNQAACGLFVLMDKVLHQAIESYPNNLFLLAVLAKVQSLVHSAGPKWWTVQNLLLRTGRAFSTLFAVLIVNQQIVKLQEILRDTITGQHFEINPNIRNRMLSLFKKITTPDMCTRRCGLVWRLYLQFVYSYFSPDLCRNVYYSAVEECPWLKALYIDAAIYIPAELAQIQDLIIEKQLRLHVTPDELDVLKLITSFVICYLNCLNLSFQHTIYFVKSKTIIC